MRALAIALVLLATPAEAWTLQGAIDSVRCVRWLYPSHARCRAPEAVQAPSVVPPPAPAVVQPPPVATPQPPPRGAQKARRPVKPKWKPAKPAKRAASPAWWCAWVPNGTPLSRMEAEARARGISWTAENRRKAQACLASK